MAVQAAHRLRPGFSPASAVALPRLDRTIARHSTKLRTAPRLVCCILAVLARYKPEVPSLGNSIECHGAQ